MKGLILAGGLGTRLRPLTHTGAKQLIPIANKPVLHYVISDLEKAGIKDIGIIVGYTPERINAIKSAIGDGSMWGVKITYIEQDAPRGLAHAVKCARSFMGTEPFVVYLGDNMLKSGITNMVEQFKISRPHASLLLAEVNNPEKYGVAVLDEKGNVIDLEEKPAKPKSNRAVVGVYLFTESIFGAIEKIKPSKNGELELTEAIRVLIREKKQVSFHLIDGWWDDTGTAEAILRANRMILSEQKSEIYGTIEPGAKIIGEVSIGKGSIVKKESVIRGPAIIGDNCIIGPAAYIGPYTSIGNNTIISDGEIESSIIIGDSKISSSKRIIDSLIGRHTTISSVNAAVPKCCKLIVGENSELQI